MSNQRHPKHVPALNTLTSLAYSAPVVPVLLLIASTNVLPGIYSKYYGLSLAAVSLAMLIAGLFDAFTDPSIGYWADRYNARTGSRKPFVIGGALFLIPSAWFLLNPGESVTFIYFLFWYLAFYLAYTLFNIPHLTVAKEVCRRSDDRNKIFAYRSLAGLIAFAIFMVIPMTSLTEGNEITPQVMHYLVVTAGILLLPMLYIYLRYLPTSAARPEFSKKSENPLRAMRELTNNSPLKLYLLGTASYFIAMSSDTALKFLVMSSYLDMGKYFGYLFLLTIIVSIIVVKPGLWFIERVGKKKGCLVAFAFNILSFSAMPLVLLKGDYSLHLYAFYSLSLGISTALANIAFYSILSDVSDYGTLKSGIDRSATCFSLQSLAQKTFMAVGIAIYIALADRFGFDPVASSQDEGVYWGLALLMGIVPIVFTLVGGLFIFLIPIDECRHDIIRRRLDAREVRFWRDAEIDKSRNEEKTLKIE
ncbi:MFS transporter [Paremcibacter congregatus]|nr:MFS transporter [Paremcibacter congregatus]